MNRTTNSVQYYDNTNTIIPSSACSAQQLTTEKIITFHSDDRDIIKNPLSNNFEIRFPHTIKNVVSIELLDISLPTFYYNISEYLQNSKLWVSIPYYFEEPIEITVPSGYYSNESLTKELAHQLNKTIATKLYNIGVYSIITSQYLNFEVVYNSNQQSVTLNNNGDKFILWFDKLSTYNTCKFDCSKMINWGLGHNLGFDRRTYVSSLNSSDLILNTHTVQPRNPINANIWDTIYFEINSFNWIDENTPFNAVDFNSGNFNSTSNSSFAKINVSKLSNPLSTVVRTLPNIEEKISTMRFKFRYHNGIPVDFLEQPINFSIRFVCKYDC